MKNSLIAVLLLVVFLSSARVWAGSVTSNPAAGSTLNFGTLHAFGSAASRIVYVSHTSVKRKSTCALGGSSYDEMGFPLRLSQGARNPIAPPFSVQPTFASMSPGSNVTFAFSVSCTKGPHTPNGNYAVTLEIHPDAAASLNVCGSYPHAPLTFNLSCTIGGAEPNPSPSPGLPAFHCNANAPSQPRSVNIAQSLLGSCSNGALPIHYNWNSADPEVRFSDASGRNTLADFSVPGIYSLQFTGRDSLGRSSTAQIKLQIDPAGEPRPASFAYVTQHAGNSLWVLDTASNRFTASIPVGRGPIAVALNADGSQAYVVNSISNDVSVIDTLRQVVVATVAVGKKPYGVSVAGTEVYVTNSLANTVSVFNAATLEPIATLAVGSQPRGIAVGPSGVYVANFGSDSVSLIQTQNHQVIATFPTGHGPTGVAVNPAGDQIYTADTLGGTLSIFSHLNQSLSSIRTGSSSFGLTTNTTFDGHNFIYVTNSGSRSLSVIDAQSDPTAALLATIPVEDIPRGIALNQNAAVAYISNSGANTLSVVDITNQKVTATLKTGPYPLGIVAHPPALQ